MNARTLSRGFAAIALAATVLAVAMTAPAGGTPITSGPATTDPPTAAAYAGRWLAAQVGADGSVAVGGSPSPGATLQTALALATAGVDRPTFERTVGWLTAHVDTVTGTGASADAGAVGYLLLVATAAGMTPTSFGGVDLVARLAGTLGTWNHTTDPGLYGPGDPTYDGTFRQSIAVLGLLAAGAPVPAAAVAWLTDRQCGTSDPMIRGGWEPYRLAADACTAGDPTAFTGVDTNDTAIAATALTAVGTPPAIDPLAWFGQVQNSTGGWGYLAGLPDDPNSDALVIQALAALGAHPPTGWAKAGGTPFTSLLGFQLGCAAAPADQGAFTFPGTDGAPNALATEQAVWGAMARPFPLSGVSFTDAPVPCQVPVTTVPGVTTTVPVTTTSTPGAGAATPVNVTPAFTG